MENEEKIIEPVRKKRKAKKLPVAITFEDYQKIMAVTKNKKHKLAFYLAYNVGLRISEVLKLDPSDFQEGKIFIRQAKGNKDRIVPIPKNFREEYLRLLPINISARALELGFKNSLKKSKVIETKPTAHFHSLRHGFATRFLELGGNIQNLKVLMGHTNIATTDIYNQLNPKIAIDDYNRLW